MRSKIFAALSLPEEGGLKIHLISSKFQLLLENRRRASLTRYKPSSRSMGHGV